MSRSKMPSMITGSNQVCLAKMTGRRVEEGRVKDLTKTEGIVKKWSNSLRNRF